ncbi:MAG: Endonuclease MutS2 [Chloroflexi bacterium]|nr:Endonuclease MutS2 [Chloroflexota bacterium]MBT9166130.1 Endonuclease MutS2 [Chloroflexota bacterium]
MSVPEPEVMLRRLSVEDALIKMDRYLNDAFTAGLYSVRIVHGKGTGTLRLVVRRELARHPLVESFRPADSWEGGHGVTIARLVGK